MSWKAEITVLQQQIFGEPHEVIFYGYGRNADDAIKDARYMVNRAEIPAENVKSYRAMEDKNGCDSN